MIRLSVKSNLNLQMTNFETESFTLAAVLDEIAEIHRLMQLCPDCEVLVNGQSYQVLTDGLDTKLKDGDEVEIIMFMLGGG